MEDGIDKILTFIDTGMLAAISLILIGWTQYLKEYVPNSLCYKEFKIPVLKIFILLSGIGISEITFRVAGFAHGFLISVYYGVVATVLGSLGYEFIKGTKLGLRSMTELKNGKADLPKP